MNLLIRDDKFKKVLDEISLYCYNNNRRLKQSVVHWLLFYGFSYHKKCDKKEHSLLNYFNRAPVAQLDRASDYGSEG